MNLNPTNCRSCFKQIEWPLGLCHQCEAIKKCTNCLRCEKELLAEKQHCMFAPKLCWGCAQGMLESIAKKEREGGLPPVRKRKKYNIWERYIVGDPMSQKKLREGGVS